VRSWRKDQEKVKTASFDHTESMAREMEEKLYKFSSDSTGIGPDIE